MPLHRALSIIYSVYSHLFFLFLAVNLIFSNSIQVEVCLIKNQVISAVVRSKSDLQASVAGDKGKPQEHRN